ncbi:MAG: beta-ketoacyl-ACP synthase II [Anaerolineae bacterium]|nr:beta-ketoacyl-ACP synthase II [Anaerolineae bacterium]
MEERIVITGMGAVTAVGHTVKENWENITAGVSGVGPITAFDAGEFLVQIAAEVKDFDPSKYLPARDIRRRDRFELMAAAAVGEALDQSGLEIKEENADRIGVVLSSAIGGITSLEEAILTVDQDGPRRVSPFAIPMLMANGAAGLAGIDHGIRGPAFSVASACASGQDGIGMAWMMLKSGMVDAAVCGASEATIRPMAVAAFDRMGAMSRRGLDQAAPTPFDLNRDGLVMGEGAGILVLERESTARARDAEILAELAGYSASADSYHITAPSKTGAGGARAMMRAIESAGLEPSDIGYINAHGTGTPLNDASETLAVKTCFGEDAYNVPISSTKSMTGHMMGATGAVETILCVQAIRENVVPPTINYQTPDPDCDLDVVPNEARDHKVDAAITNSFGFGGHNAVLVVKAYS